MALAPRIARASQDGLIHDDTIARQTMAQSRQQPRHAHGQRRTRSEDRINDATRSSHAKSVMFDRAIECCPTHSV
jgi:hypothetical protein